MKKKIKVKVSGRDSDTAYIALPGYGLTPGVVAKTIRIEDLIGSYRGPWVNFDFGRDGMLIGIEIIVTGGPGSATQS